MRTNPFLPISMLVIAMSCSNPVSHPFPSGDSEYYYEQYSTLPLRESPYADFKGVVRLSATHAFDRNHYEFKYDSLFRLISAQFKLRNTLINPNHTANYFFTTSEQRFKYDGNREIRTFYDMYGNQVDQRGAFYEIYSKNDRGRYESLYFENESGERVQNDWGIYEYQWEEKNDGSIIEKRYDRAGDIVSLRPGFEFFTIRLVYHQNGTLALMQNIDSLGMLVENTSGAAQDKLHFDKKGRWLGWTVLDKAHQLKRGNGPNVAKGINGTDAYGYERSIRYEDIDGKPIINSHGFWGSTRHYDDFGNYDYTQFLNKEGKPGVHEKYGYSMAKYHWSEDGLRRLKVELMDVDKKPALHKSRGYATITQEYDSLGRLVKTSFLGAQHEPINRIDNGIAYLTYTYDKKNKLKETNRYNKDGLQIK